MPRKRHCTGRKLKPIYTKYTEYTASTMQHGTDQYNAWPVHFVTAKDYTTAKP